MIQFYSLPICNSIVNNVQRYLYTALVIGIISLPSYAQIIDFNLASSSGCTNQDITCINATTHPSASIYQWTFGDGTPMVQESNTTTINHTYINNGTYTIQMDVFNAFMLPIGNATKSITINGISSWDQLNLWPEAGCPGEDISFNAPWGYNQYVFNKGDGSPNDTTFNSWNNYQYSAPGTYIASVGIQNTCGGMDTVLTDTVTINSSMSFPNWLNIGSSNANACPIDDISFWGPWGFASYEWNFGDGNSLTTTNSNVNHVYGIEGTFAVTCRVFNFCGNDTLITMTQQVQYPPFPMMSLYVNPTPACPGESISLSAPWGYTSYIWDYGDGSPVDTSMDAWKNHIYSTLGSFTASVTLTQFCGNDTTLSNTVNINSYVPFPGWADLSTNPDPACPFESIYLYSAWGYPAYEWNFGDGSPVENGTDANTNHVYTSQGDYPATLTITNLCGNDTTLIDTVHINNTLPFPGSISYYLSANPACPGNISFTASSGFQFYTWDFGDGSGLVTTTTNNTSHSYPNLGSYPISLKLVNYCGADTTLYDMLEVEYAAFPGGMYLNFNPSTACPNEKVNFNASWGYVSYDWNFGDGTTFTGSNYTSHKYAAVGVYIVTVKVNQLCGNDTTLTDTVRIVNNQVIPSWVSVNANPDPACPTKDIDIGGPWGFASYEWDYGDGNTDTTSDSYLKYQYTTAGDYEIALTVYNFCGLDTTLYDSITIDNNLPVESWVNLSVMYQNGMSACPGEFINLNGPWGYPSYIWDYGDGTPIDSGSFQVMNHSYSEAGIYTVALTVANECGNDTTLYEQVNIDDNKPFGMASLWSSMSPVCPGADMTFTAPDGYAAYVWNFGDGTALDSTNTPVVNRSFAGAGTYNVEVKIIDYCGKDTTVSAMMPVTIDDNLFVWGSVNMYPNPICPNQEAIFSTDSGHVSYLWDFGDGFSAYGPNETNHSYSALGDYDVEVTITNHCGNTGTFGSTITVDTTTSFPSWMNFWGNPWQVCPGEIITLVTEKGFNNYFWDFGDGDTVTTSGSSIGHAYGAAGSYDAAVTITNGCGNSTTLTTTMNVSTSTNVFIPQIKTSASAYCPGDQVTFLLSSWNGGEENYTYVWDFGDGNIDTTIGVGATHMYDSTGSFTTSVTIMNACGNTEMVIVPVTIINNAAPNLNSNIFGTLASTTIAGCAGDAVVFYFQGTSDNLWDFGDGSTGEATEEFTDANGITMTVIKHAYSSIGTYTVQLTLTNGCGNSTTDSLSIQISDNFLVDGGLILEPPATTGNYTTCSNINMITFGGSSYDWDFGDGSTLTTISPTISHVFSDEGNYSISVTITNGCGNSTTFSDAVTIVTSGGISPNISVASTVTCYEGTDGSAMASPSGGLSPYQYQWDDNNTQTTATATGLSEGTYAVTITDDMGCTSDTSIAVGEADEISLSTSTNDATCGFPNGTGTAVVDSGGVSPFTYVWSTGGTSSTETGLASGSTAVTVTDADGCTNTATAAVSDIGGASLSISAAIDATCNGSSDGALTASASGGTAPYGYSWSNGETTAALTGLAAGEYIVTVTDASTCLTVGTGFVDEPDALEASFEIVQGECGEATGTATVSVSGGTSGYFYQWDSNANSQITETATELAANAYEVIITDANSCILTATATVGNSNSPSIVANGTNVSCFGASDGSIDLSVAGGTTPYVYLWTWSGGSSFVEDLSGLDAGAYTVMIQDASDCWVGTSVTITEPDLSTTITSIHTGCIGGTAGAASVSVSSGYEPYTYLWSTTETTLAIANLSAGTYTLAVTDSNGCIANDTTIISDPAAISTSISATNVSCNGGSDGAAELTVSGGSEPYTYLWDNPSASTTANITVLNANTYRVTITDSCGVIAMDSIEITEPVLLTVAISATDVNCYGGGDGTATATPSGGTAPYNYLWNNGQTDSIAVGLFPSLQSINVFDVNGCIGSNNITIGEPGALTASVAATDATCYGGSGGSVTLNLSGGTSPYTYSWSNGPTTMNNPGVIAGTYTITVTDSCGIAVTSSATVAEPDAPSLISTYLDISCNGSDDGSIDLTVSGGTLPYTYLWSNSETTEDLSGLTANTYTVDVKDACTLTLADTIDIIEPALLTVAVTSTDVNCYGGGDGTATASPTGGTLPYNYAWNTGQTDSIAVGLFPGLQTINVFDVNGCMGSNAIIITEPNPIDGTVIGSDATCNGGTGGSADLSISGGTTPYSYLWSNNDVTEDLSSVSAGSYSVTVTDSCGATFISSVTINEPTALSSNLTVTGVTCYGNADGEANVSVSGGTEPYTYLWSTTETTASIASLDTGTFTVDISDACSAILTDTAVVSEPAVLTTSMSQVNVSCYGSGDGTATVTPAGGTAPFNYLWNNGQVTSTALGLFPGSYTINITDVNGCLTTDLVSITEPPTLNAVIVSVTDVSCNSDSTGVSVVNASGGTPPYNYLWNDAASQTDSNAIGLPAGSYNVLITDFCGATTTLSSTVSEPSALVISTSKTDVTCTGYADGLAEVTASGGTGPFTYLWSPSGSTTENIVGATPGIHIVMVTSACGNAVNDSVMISEPAVLTTAISQTDVSCNNGGNGTASVLAGGGIPPYNYLWSNGQTNPMAIGLFPGGYSVNITDSNGCLTSDLVTIIEPAPLTSSLSSTPVSCLVGNNGTVSVMATDGTLPYTYLWSPTGDTTAMAAGLAEDTYTVTLVDSCGATIIDSVIVGGPSSMSIGLVASHVSCNGYNNGIIDLTVSNGSAPLYYLWSSGDTTEDVSGLSPGMYSITVTDSCGTALTDSLMITEPAPLTTSISSVNATCNGMGDGSASVAVIGGTAPYNYTWNNGQFTSTSFALFPGNYSVNVIDFNGCLATDLVIIGEPLALSIAMNITDATCGESDGSAEAMVSGGQAPYVYSWSSGGSSSIDSALAGGNYSLMVSDTNGCSDSLEVAIPITAPVQEICIITVDSTSTKNVVVWEKPIATNIDSFHIYRDIIGTYTLVGSQPYGVESYFTDSTNGVNPKVTSYRYKVTTVDACGNESLMGNYHETIHTQTTDNGSTVDILWDNYEGFNFGFYRILRDSTGLGGANWEKLDSVANSNFTYSDVNPPSIGAAYVIEVVANAVCVADKVKNYNSSKSNTSSFGGTSNITVTTTSTDASFGGCDGTATVTASGGKEPYTYLWDGSTGFQATAMAAGLCAGNYSVTVTDANGETSVTSQTVAETGGSALTASTTSSDVNEGICDGTATVSASGGTPPYTYVWDGNTNSQTSETATGLCAGTYSVIVFDSNDQLTTVFVTVDELVGIVEFNDEMSAVSVFPNPYTDQTKISYILNRKADVALEVYSIIGDKVVMLANEEQNAGNHAFVFGAKGLGYPAGIYMVRLKVNGNIYTKRLIEMK